MTVEEVEEEEEEWREMCRSIETLLFFLSVFGLIFFCAKKLTRSMPCGLPVTGIDFVCSAMGFTGDRQHQ